MVSKLDLVGKQCLKGAPSWETVRYLLLALRHRMDPAFSVIDNKPIRMKKRMVEFDLSQ
jgi:hypothetical protein